MFKGEGERSSFEDLAAMEAGLRADHIPQIETLTDLLNALPDQSPRQRRGTYRQIVGIINTVNGGNLSPKEVRQVMRALGLQTPRISR